MAQKKFSLLKQLKSFAFAFNGLGILLREEHNARIHLVAAICAILLGFYFDISTLEWVVVCFAIGSVFAAEAFNSALEKMADFVTTEIHPQIKRIKDLAAGAVLITAIAALAVGLLIFIPKILLLLI